MGIFKKKETAVSASKKLSALSRAEQKSMNDILDKAEGYANKVYEALGKERNVQYDVSKYTNKDGVDKISVKISFSCFDSKNRDNKTSQMVSLSFNAETGKAYVKVQSYDGTKFNEVDFKNFYDSTKGAIVKLEKAGLTNEWLTKEYPEGKAGKEYTPAENIRYKVSKQAQELNKTNKAVNKEGKEVGEYYCSEVKDASYTAKTGENISQEIFELRSHKGQGIEVSITDGQVVRLRAKVYTGYDFEQKAGEIQSAKAYNLEYAKEKFTGLDQNLIEAIEKADLPFRPYKKSQEAPEMEAPEQEVPGWDEPEMDK